MIITERSIETLEAQLARLRAKFDDQQAALAGLGVESDYEVGAILVCYKTCVASSRTYTSTWINTPSGWYSSSRGTLGPSSFSEMCEFMIKDASSLHVGLVTEIEMLS